MSGAGNFGARHHQALVLGAGPTGLMVGASLAQRGWRVVVADPDPGPGVDGSWRRRKVMQFDHPHAFRPQVADFLRAQWPSAWHRWHDLGAEAMELPGPLNTAVGVRSRRITLERALWTAAAEIPNLRFIVGAANRLVGVGGRVAGAVVDGAVVDADLVIDATGRLSRFARATSYGGDTGMAYITRAYRRPEQAPLGPMTGPVAWYGAFDGYDAYVFPHEAGHFSVVLIRPTANAALAVARRESVFEWVCRAIPALREWTDPAVATPSTPVMVGGRLHNTYRPQHRRAGLVCVGDSVTTTTPTAGRGVAMATMQITALLDLLDRGADPATVAEPFDEWCADHMLTWVEDHVANDAAAVRRWHGDDIDLTAPLTSTQIANAAIAEPAIAAHLDGYFHMTQPPRALAPAEPLARAVYETGWRPPTGDGPTADDIVEAADAAISA